jgi:uncharacterized cupin superfamily protein
MPDPEQDPKVPVHESDVSVETWYEGTEREILGKALCDVGGRAKIGFGLLELPPGCNTRPAHYHTLEEEHVYVLEGRMTLHLGEQEFALKPGSYVHFPAAQPHHHYLENRGTESVRYIIVGERLASDEVVYAGGRADAEDR